jgi:hypothetical protein
MEAQDAKFRRRQLAARVVTGVLAVIISIGLWQMYGSWLMSAAGEYGS